MVLETDLQALLYPIVPLNLKTLIKSALTICIETKPLGLIHLDGGEPAGALLHLEGDAVVFVQFVAFDVVDVNEDAFAGA